MPLKTVGWGISLGEKRIILVRIYKVLNYLSANETRWCKSIFIIVMPLTWYDVATFIINN